MKRAVTTAGTAVLVLALASCVQQSSLDMVQEDDRIELTASNAGPAREASAELEIQNGEFLEVKSGVETGGIGMTVTRQASGQAVFERTFEKTETAELPLEEGTYEVFLEVLNAGTNGTLTIRRVQLDSQGKPAEEQSLSAKDLGDYVCDRCMIHVEELENGEERFTVRWGSSVSEYSEWVMSGPLEPDTQTVNYRNAVRKNITVENHGGVESEETVYQNGRGFFRFDGAKLYWNDEEEHIADNMEFGFAIVD